MKFFFCFTHLDNIQVIEKLIEKGANVNHVDMAGSTPLQKAKGNFFFLNFPINCGLIMTVFV